MAWIYIRKPKESIKNTATSKYIKFTKYKINFPKWAVRLYPTSKELEDNLNNKYNSIKNIKHLGTNLTRDT